MGLSISGFTPLSGAQPTAAAAAATGRYEVSTDKVASALHSLPAKELASATPLGRREVEVGAPAARLLGGANGLSPSSMPAFSPDLIRSIQAGLSGVADKGG